jgi:hypothetical protein
MTSTQDTQASRGTEQAARSAEEVYAELIAEADSFLEDCFSDYPDHLSADEIRAAINRHYCGGWTAFVVDSGY